MVNWQVLIGENRGFLNNCVQDYLEWICWKRLWLELESLQGKMNHKVIGISWPIKKPTLRRLPNQKGFKMPSKFQIQKSKNGKFFFHLLSANGEVILTSQMYSSRETAKKGIARR